MIDGESENFENNQNEDSENEHNFSRKTTVSAASTNIDKSRSYTIASYRPAKCPVSNCGSLFSPSTMLSHFLYIHRDITAEVLDITKSSITINISLQYRQLEPMKSVVVKTILLQGFRYEALPVLLNMNLLPTMKYKIDNGSNKKFESNWLIIWLSSLCTFPFTFLITIQSYGLPRLSFTQICSPVVLHEENEIKNELSSLILDPRTMLMNIESIEKLIKQESGLYVEVTITHDEYT